MALELIQKSVPELNESGTISGITVAKNSPSPEGLTDPLFLGAPHLRTTWDIQTILITLEPRFHLIKQLPTPTKPFNMQIRTYLWVGSTRYLISAAEYALIKKAIEGEIQTPPRKVYVAELLAPVTILGSQDVAIQFGFGPSEPERKSEMAVFTSITLEGNALIQLYYDKTYAKTNTPK